mgnify:CR=1 FL=1
MTRCGREVENACVSQLRVAPSSRGNGQWLVRCKFVVEQNSQVLSIPVTAMGSEYGGGSSACPTSESPHGGKMGSTLDDHRTGSSFSSAERQQRRLNPKLSTPRTFVGGGESRTE